MRAGDFGVLRAQMYLTSKSGTFTYDDFVSYKNAWRQPCAMQTMLNWYRALMQFPPRRKRAFHITMPTTILWGRRDAYLYELFATASLRKCANGNIQFFEDAGHWLQHEKPQQVVDAILKAVKAQQY